MTILKVLITSALLLSFQFDNAFAQQQVTPAKDKCVSGNCVNGRGKMAYADGNIYEGTFVKKLPSGKGKLTYPNGNLYVGSFLNGKFHGIGTFTIITGDVYTGQFVDGMTKGKGRSKYANGDTYVGDFGNGKDGLGTYTFKDGSVFIGRYANNVRDGNGKIKYADGDSYEGNWAGDQYNGLGTYTFKDGEVYVGEFANNQRNGKGRTTYANGDFNEGSFLNGQRHGVGKEYIKAMNTTREGFWKDEVFVGKSSEITPKTESEWQKVCEPFVRTMETAVNTKKDDASAMKIYTDFEAATKDAGASTSVRNSRKSLLKTMHQSNSYPLIKFVREKLKTLNFNEEETKDILSPKLFYV